MMAVAIFAFYGTKADPVKTDSSVGGDSRRHAIFRPAKLTNTKQALRFATTIHTKPLNGTPLNLPPGASCISALFAEGGTLGQRARSTSATAVFVSSKDTIYTRRRSTRYPRIQHGTLRPEEIRSFMKELVMTAVVSVDSLVHVSAPLFPCSMVNVVR
ncbi:hypothetical protein EDD16DRAFT_1776498 [Pisolithus croceorrhizus]|nr:hypothetical protein EDD16DRAFT_1776498 [Pisolithus croceorrhizus]